MHQRCCSAGFSQGSNYEAQSCKFHLSARRAGETEGRGSHRAGAPRNAAAGRSHGGKYERKQETHFEALSFSAFLLALRRRSRRRGARLLSVVSAPSPTSFLPRLRGLENKTKPHSIQTVRPISPLQHFADVKSRVILETERTNEQVTRSTVG